MGGNDKAQMGEASLDPETDDLLRREVERLADEFRGMFSRETIDRCARESVGWLTGARVKRYLPIFAYRFTRERLLALAGVEGLRPVDRPHILFVCVRNAARSQIAAALAQHLSGGAIEAHSAGSAPAKQIDPAAVEVMRELGVDLSQEFPKPLADEVVRAADVVVTMGCGDACRLYPFKKYEDWSIEDPAGQPLEKVREIRDAIRAHVERLLAELGVLSAR
ncbi:MAG: putative arsenate reductase ArsC [Dehalococcoidia bacterium]|nr:MAG: putative arsenate reductase ArsC [Dehalococcoidia bacterium]